mmetsp:Transcript_23887/g.38353  ORF Transcript_23887/g.38353 Transcript_23887/m.38353 type:complete len:282 (-) Transcript_23887:248-1093(-)
MSTFQCRIALQFLDELLATGFQYLLRRTVCKRIHNPLRFHRHFLWHKQVAFIDEVNHGECHIDIKSKFLRYIHPCLDEFQNLDTILCRVRRRTCLQQRRKLVLRHQQQSRRINVILFVGVDNIGAMHINLSHSLHRHHCQIHEIVALDGILGRHHLFVINGTSTTVVQCRCVVIAAATAMMHHVETCVGRRIVMIARLWLWQWSSQHRRLCGGRSGSLCRHILLNHTHGKLGAVLRKATIGQNRRHFLFLIQHIGRSDFVVDELRDQQISIVLYGHIVGRH